MRQLVALLIVAALCGVNADNGGRGKVSAKTDFRTISTTGSSGWIQFCRPSDEGASGDVDPSDKCVSIRAFGFSEVDASGKVVAISAAGNGPKRRMSNLHSVMQVSAAASAKMAVCGTSAAKEGQACGVAADGGALEYEAVPIAIDLSSIATSGELSLTSIIFKNNGTMAFDGRNYSVHRGMTKFDMSIRNYTFGATGAKVQFQLRVKNRNHNESEGSVATNTSGVVLIDKGGIICMPRYSVRASALSAVEWKTANVAKTDSDDNAVFQFTFEGPFVEMDYDPVVSSDVIDGLAEGSPSISAASPNSPTFLAAVASLLLAAATVGYVL